MSVTIAVNGTEATVRNGEWTSDLPALTDLLNAIRPDAGPWVPDLDQFYSLAAIEFFEPAAVFVSERVPADEHVRGRVY